MGIADFGVSALGGAYSYSTPIFRSTVNFTSFNPYSSTLPTEYQNWSTFQQNIVLRFVQGAVTYYYWVQSIGGVFANNGNTTFFENVWNMSTVSQKITNSSITGNGSLLTEGAYTAYAAAANPSAPGNDQFHTYPFGFSLEAVASTVDGRPHVNLGYLDGAEWEWFDNVTFPWATNASSVGFVVDGSNYNPQGTFFDAEFVDTGSGGFTQTTATALEPSNFTMSLQYWNGHNLQAPSNAFDFGSDTGEVITNVTEAWTADPISGTLEAKVSSGYSPLHLLYGIGNVSELQVSSQLENGSLQVGTDVVPYTGGLAEFALGPGDYNVVLIRNGTPAREAAVNLVAGETTAIQLSPQAFAVTVTEPGLPSGAGVTVSIDSVLVRNQNSTAIVDLWNGTYSFAFAAEPGYWASGRTGTFTVAGLATDLTLDWSAFLFGASFVESNLPSGLNWSVTVANSTVSSASSVVNLQVPNGSYAFQVRAPAGYSADPATGTFRVNAGPTSIPVAFAALPPGLLTGTLAPVDASLLLDGVAVATDGGSFTISLSVGNHSLESVLVGYAPYFGNVSIVSGGTAYRNISLERVGGGQAPAPASRGPVPPSEWAVLFIAALVPAIVLVALVVRWRRRPPTARRPTSAVR